MEYDCIPDFVEEYYICLHEIDRLKESEKKIKERLLKHEEDVKTWLQQFTFQEHQHTKIGRKIWIKQFIKKELINKNNLTLYMSNVFIKLYGDQLCLKEIHLLTQNICSYIWASRKNETVLKLCTKKIA